ncbi:MAG: glycosyltransferase 87 family protein [Chloroflexi bacterium]|nr:glycosyltransferase 87 family protein [Chloroflexota bacterium]
MIQLNNMKNALIKIIEKFIYCLAISMSIWTFWFVLSKDFLQTRGFDANIFCLAGQAIRHGRNPYLTNELGTVFSWNYLPIFAHGFRILCSRFNFQLMYIFYYSLILLFALEIWIRGKSWVYGAVLCITGLYSFGWIIYTGNISVVELYLLSLSASLFFKKKYALAMFLLGLNASIKITPVLYLPIFFLFIEQKKERMKVFPWVLAGFLFPFLISGIFNLNLMPWYFKQLLGVIPGQHSAFKEYNSFYFTNPLFISLLFNILGIDKIITINFALAIIGFAIGAGVLYLIWLRMKLRVQSENNMILLFCFSIIIFTLLMPRLKPYSFLPALLFFYVASSNQRRWLQSIYLLLLSILPNLLSYAYKYDISISLLENLPNVLNRWFLIIEIFNQPFFLILATFLLLFQNENLNYQNDNW